MNCEWGFLNHGEAEINHYTPRLCVFVLRGKVDFVVALNEEEMGKNNGNIFGCRCVVLYFEVVHAFNLYTAMCIGEIRKYSSWDAQAHVTMSAKLTQENSMPRQNCTQLSSSRPVIDRGEKLGHKKMWFWNRVDDFCFLAAAAVRSTHFEVFISFLLFDYACDEIL